MKMIWLWPVAWLLFFVAVAWPQNLPQEGDSSEFAKIRELEQRDAAAAKANDVEVLTSLWTDDGVLVVPMVAPVVGRPAIRALLLQQKRTAGGVVTLDYQEDWRERRIEGDQCFEWGSITAKLELPNGKKLSQTGYLARLLIRDKEGTWKFARAVVTPGPRE